MAKVKRFFVLATCFLSGFAAILTFVSLGTRQWVVGHASPESVPQDEKNTVEIGLFTGVFNQDYGNTVESLLTLTCLMDANICSMMCDIQGKQDDLRDMLDGKEVLKTCDVNSNRRKTMMEPKASPFHTEYGQNFINAGVLACTVIFLIVSGLLGCFACALAIWNTATNPYQTYFSIFAMYIYNGVASGCALVALILWGALFGTTLKHNVPSYQTYSEFTTDGRTQLGYSYWLNLVSIFLYLGSIGLLYLREYLISKEPEVKVNLDENVDTALYLY